MLRKLIGLTPLGSLLDWMEAMTYRQGIIGALLGAALTALHFFLSGFPEESEEALTSILAGAVLGCYWLIHITVGLLNGYARPIRWGGAVLGLFMLAACAGHDRDGVTPYLSLLLGVGAGTLCGAMMPLAAFRLGSRIERKSPLRRFALLLAYPSLRFHEDNPKSIVSDSDPFETRLLLQQRWGVWSQEELHDLLELLQAEDRLGQTVEVVRWAVTDSMLTKAEGWKLLERVGQRALELYGGWEEFATHDALCEHLRACLQMSLREKRGLWKLTPWPKS